MARRRRGGARSRRSRAGVGWGGLFILLLAGTGIWIGAGLVEGDALDRFRSLEREEPVAAVEAPGSPSYPSYDARVRVEVLNAGGVRGMAAEARDALRGRGFDVVHYGNAASFGREASVVLHRGGALEAARAVAEALRIHEVRSEPDSTLLVEVTVLLGSSWTGREGEGAGGETSGATGRQPEEGE